MPGKTMLLVVDDDEAVLTVLKTKLERTGRFEVFGATGGEHALRRVAEVRPDLVVCDIDMPDMDGGELAAALRESPATASVPVVFLSALVAPEESARGPVGGWPMLSKRSSVGQLVKNRRAAGGEPALTRWRRRERPAADAVDRCLTEVLSPWIS